MMTVLWKNSEEPADEAVGGDEDDFGFGADEEDGYRDDYGDGYEDDFGGGYDERYESLDDYIDKL